MSTVSINEQPPLNKKTFGQRLKLELKNHWQIYLMALPVVVYFLVFNYAPMVGIVMGFQKFNIRKGIFGSPWVGFDQFIQFPIGLLKQAFLSPAR
jgi:putative aldouronate transport system permease protein